MKNNFDKCLEMLLHHEGGYVNHPSDPGGETNKGVTKKVYVAFGGTKDMKDLEFDDAQQSFLLSIFNNEKMIIEGLAGTGKTIIAAKIACDPEYDDKKVLILTKTKGLSQFLKVLTKNKIIEIVNNCIKFNY
jgi:superfamily II DNA or RNA helicase